MVVRRFQSSIFLVGRTGGAVGAQIAAFIVPSVAVLSLGGGPMLTAILAICQWGAFPLLAVPFGWLVDKYQGRRVALGVSSDLLQVIVMMGACGLAVLGGLMQWHLIAVAVLIGTAAVMFDLSIMAAVNSKLEGSAADRAMSLTSLSRNLGLLTGPVLGGFLVDIFDPPVAFLVTAAFFLVSAVCIAVSLGALPEIEQHADLTRSPVGSGAFEGIKVLFRSRTLLAFAVFSGSLNLGMQWIQAGYFVYAYDVVLASPSAVGIIFGIGAGFGAIAAIMAPQVVKKYGLYKPLVVSAVLTFLGWAVLLMAEISVWLGLGLSSILVSLSLPVVFVAQAAARRDLAPSEVQGRLYSAMTLVAFITVPVGYLAGGLIGELMSVRVSIVSGVIVVGVGVVVAVLAVLRAERSAMVVSQESERV